MMAEDERRSELERIVAEINPRTSPEPIPPHVQAYHDGHGPCERPAELAFLCVRVGLASFAPLLPEFGEGVIEALHQGGALSGTAETPSTLDVQGFLQKHEQNFADFWLATAKELDDLLEISGCGPHQWRPQSSMFLSPITPEPWDLGRDTPFPMGEGNFQNGLYGNSLESSGGSGGGQ